MARATSKANLGYYAIDERHHAAILSLVAPATPAHKLLDPLAGEGAFLQAAARTWNVTPYANELDGDRAEVCITRFGPKQAVRCDVERLTLQCHLVKSAIVISGTYITFSSKTCKSIEKHRYLDAKKRTFLVD